MHEAIKIISILPLVALFLDYAVAMQKVAPCGTRRALNTYSRQMVVSSGQLSRLSKGQGFTWSDGIRA